MWVRIPDDVPIHRPSVGAMSVTMGSQAPDNFDRNFKPYVYRGTGEDTLTPHLGEDWARGEGQPEPETARKRKRKRTRTRKPKRYTHAQVRERIDAAAYRKYQRQRGRFVAEEYELVRVDGAIPLPAPPTPPSLPRKIRSHPDWKPLSSSDIDDIMADLGL